MQIPPGFDVRRVSPGLGGTGPPKRLIFPSSALVPNFYLPF